MIVICTRCQRDTASVYRHITICAPCDVALTAAHLVYCNVCQTAHPAKDMYRRWRCYGCYSARQRAYYASHPAYREQVRRIVEAWRDRHREATRAASRAYYARHKHRWQRPEVQAQENATRRARYASDAAYRERRKAQARAYWPIHKYKLRVVRRKEAQ